MDEVICPKCGNLVEMMRFCSECGSELPSVCEVTHCCNQFSESDSLCLDKLNYNIGRVSSGNKSDDIESNGIIRALGDIENVPPDYKGRIYSTGKIVFSKAEKHVATLGYESEGFSTQEKFAYINAFTIKREGTDVVIQTDVSSYKMAGLGDSQKRVFSRTPIAVVHNSKGAFMMCEKEGEYIFESGTALDLHSIHQLSPMKRYRIGKYGFLQVE